MIYLFIVFTVVCMVVVFALNFFKFVGSIVSLLVTVVILAIVFSAPGGSPFLGPGMIAIITGHGFVGGTTASLVHRWKKSVNNPRGLILILSVVSLSVLAGLISVFGERILFMHFFHFENVIGLIAIGVLMGALTPVIKPRSVSETSLYSNS